METIEKLPVNWKRCPNCKQAGSIMQDFGYRGKREQSWCYQCRRDERLVHKQPIVSRKVLKAKYAIFYPGDKCTQRSWNFMAKKLRKEGFNVADECQTS